VIFIAGGTGFVGSYLISHLIDAGMNLRVLMRSNCIPSPLFKHPGIEKFQGNILDPDTLIDGMAGCTTVINCVGIILETKKQTFQKMHVEAVENLVNAAKASGVEKIIHMSALGTSSKPVSEYFRTKHEGEEVIKNSGLNHTILRPSLIFGKGDKFFPVLKNLVKLPVTPVIGKGKNRFQPVFVEDLAKCVGTCITNKKTDNRTFEIGGPEVLSFIDMLDVVAAILNKRCFRIHIPVSVVRAFAIVFDIFLSEPPISRDQLKMLKVDNVTVNNAAEEVFNLELTDLKTGLSSYL
jgi:NADH dehydrogenase